MDVRGTLKVWHIPQIPGKPFEYYVNSLKEAAILLDVLAEYDLFQYENKIKPDYSNAQGIVVWDGEDWVDVDINDKEDEKFIQDIKIGEHNA